MIDLPHFAAESGFADWRAHPARWLPAVREIARSAGIPTSVLSPFGTGTNLVVDLDGRFVLKLFPPLFRAQYASERSALRQLAGQLSVPIPTVLAEGEQDGWSWLVMTKLNGIIGSEAWPTLPEPEKGRVLEEIGRTIAEVQRVPVGDLATIEPAWPAFVARQVAGCVERHRRQGLASRFLTDLPELISGVPTAIPLHTRPVILTGEWVPENLLLSERAGRWRLAAVIDFGDVLTGWPEYDLLGPSTFMGGGFASRIDRLFKGYGLTPVDRTPAMRRRLLTLMVLHRASDLRTIRIDGWDARIETLFDLEDVIWPA